MIRHPFDRTDVSLIQLRGELATRLGRPVELVTSEPTDAEPNGVLIIEDRSSGEWLDVDPAVVAEVVTSHVPPPRRLSAEEQALAEFEAATTIPERQAVFRAYLARMVADQQALRDRVARDRERRRRERREIARRDQS